MAIILQGLEDLRTRKLAQFNHNRGVVRYSGNSYFTLKTNNGIYHLSEWEMIKELKGIN